MSIDANRAIIDMAIDDCIKSLHDVGAKTVVIMVMHENDAGEEYGFSKFSGGKFQSIGLAASWLADATKND